MKKLIYVFFSLSVFSFAAEKTPFRLNIDYAKFKGDEEHIYYEVYYSFDVSLLKYLKTGSTYQSEAVVSIWFKRSSDDSIVAHQAVRIPFGLSDTSMLEMSRAYIDVFGFMLKPDVYRAYFVAYDGNKPMIRDSLSAVIKVESLPDEKAALSDVELCSSLIQIEKDSTNRFYKNTFEVKPNPSRMFGLHQPVLFYYLESYNLKKVSGEKYYTKAMITNAIGNEVVSHEKTKQKMSDAAVEYGMMKVGTLKTGAYTFTYSVIDSENNSMVSTSKRLFIYNPSLPPDSLVAPITGGVTSSEFATMSEEELDKMFDQSRYLSTKQEIDRYKKLKGLDAKRKALFEFWESRDEDISTPINEKKQDYFRRIAIANQQYKTGFREGWKTDRGRVYILYGPYDDIERHNNEIDTKPYEIWFYNSIQGGVQFIFGDRTGFSDFVLLHSTHRNELHDENWKRQILAQ